MKLLLAIILFTGISYLFLSGCGKNQNPFNGNVYFHDADSLAFIAGFDNDTLYYIIRGPKVNQSHKSKYTSKKISDSSYVIEVEKKPVFWTKNTWDIVLPADKNDKGFYSAESRNYYKYSPDKNILR